ncbi:hypothetical protein ACTVJ2_03950 [Serratia nevei]|uniref:hypothetical protein n=1 Tax=Serratia nevei TaxID=2703794 RepID=UPI003FA6D0DD
MNQTTISAPAASSERLPLGGLLALAMAAFITLLTEIMPAGVLSSIAGDLSVSESLAGQFITASRAERPLLPGPSSGSSSCL